MTMPSCLYCEEARPYAPKCTRSRVRHRCAIWLFDVDASMIPGLTIECPRARMLPFSDPTRRPLPAELL